MGFWLGIDGCDGRETRILVMIVLGKRDKDFGWDRWM